MGALPMRGSTLRIKISLSMLRTEVSSSVLGKQAAGRLEGVEFSTSNLVDLIDLILPTSDQPWGWIQAGVGLRRVEKMASQLS